MFGIGMPGGWEWVAILIVVFIFFGAGKLPDVFAQAGRGIKAFKDASEGRDTETAERESSSGGGRKAPKQLARDVDDLDDDETGDEVPASRGRSSKS